MITLESQRPRYYQRNPSLPLRDRLRDEGVESLAWSLMLKSPGGWAWGPLQNTNDHRTRPGDEVISEETEHDASETNLFFPLLSSRNAKQLPTTQLSSERGSSGPCQRVPARMSTHCSGLGSSGFESQRARLWNPFMENHGRECALSLSAPGLAAAFAFVFP